MKVIDQILLEWSFRCPDGVVDINNPKKKAILDEILKEFNVSLNEADEEVDSQEQTTSPKINPKNTEMGSVLISTYGKDIPKPTTEVKLGTNFNLTGDDSKVFSELFEKTPSKAGSDVQTKGSGNGEVSVFWLFSQSGHTVTDERGSDKPDLKIDNLGVEVKAYDTATITLGKFAKDKESLRLLNIVFGFRSLVSSIKGNDKEANPANFNSQDLINAFNQMFSFSENETLKKIAEENGFDVITEIYNKIDLVKKELNLKTTNPDEAAAAILRKLAINKLSKKPGIPGYILNVTKDGKGVFYTIIADKLQTADNKTILNSVKINQAQIDMNFKNIFG